MKIKEAGLFDNTSTYSDNLFGGVSFGGGGGGGGGRGGRGGSSGARRNTDKAMQIAGATAACASSTYLAAVIPPVTPPTIAAKTIAHGVAIVSCSIAASPIVKAATK